MLINFEKWRIFFGYSPVLDASCDVLRPIAHKKEILGKNIRNFVWSGFDWLIIISDNLSKKTDDKPV